MYIQSPVFKPGEKIEREMCTARNSDFGFDRSRVFGTEFGNSRHNRRRVLY